jgi:hypothetical protein
MGNVKDSVQSNSPDLAQPFDMTDEQLTLDLRTGSGKRPGQYPVGELLARHWEAVSGYAGQCTTGPQAAGMLTTAAFTRVFGDALRQTGPTAAWRPELLITVRRIVGEWDAGDRRELVHPELRSREHGKGRDALRLPPAEDRRLVFRAFQQLSEPARCILWHAEVEAEKAEIPAGLLGLGADDIPMELYRSRERFRDGCLRAHRDLAPGEECRHYSRLLDVSVRRGDAALDPDLRRHMSRCAHCRYAAGQLDHSGGRVAMLLTEALLGWGARAYLDSRPGRHPGIVDAGAEADVAPVRVSVPMPALVPVPVAVPARLPMPMPVTLGVGSELVVGPRHSARGRSRGRDAGRPNGRQVVLAVLGISGCILLPLALWSSPWSSSGADTGNSTTSGTVAGAGVSGASPSWIASGDNPSDDVLRGRLHDAATGLCMDVDGGALVVNAEAIVSKCGSSPTQQWSYEPDGQLRSEADPSLCLASSRNYSLGLGKCTDASASDAKDVRYDFTVQGALVPRWSQELAVTPVSRQNGAALVLKTRDDSTLQQWLPDDSGPSPQTDGTIGVATGDPLVRVAATLPAPVLTPTGTVTASPSATHSKTPAKTASPSASASTTCFYCYPGGYGYGYGSGYGYGYGDSNKSGNDSGSNRSGH